MFSYYLFSYHVLTKFPHFPTLLVSFAIKISVFHSLSPSSYHKNYTIHVLFSSSWKDSALYSVSFSLPNKSLQCKRFPTTTCLALIFMYKCSLCVISTWIVENHVSCYSHSTYICNFIGARCMSFPPPI